MHKQAAVFAVETIAKLRCWSFNAVFPGFERFLVSYVPLARSGALAQKTPIGDLSVPADAQW